MEEKNYALSAKTLDALLQYLGGKPYIEVVRLIQAIEKDLQGQLLTSPKAEQLQTPTLPKE